MAEIAPLLPNNVSEGAPAAPHRGRLIVAVVTALALGAVAANAGGSKSKMMSMVFTGLDDDDGHYVQRDDDSDDATGEKGGWSYNNGNPVIDDDSNDKILGIAPPCTWTTGTDGTDDDDDCVDDEGDAQKPLVRPPTRASSRGNGGPNPDDPANGEKGGWSYNKGSPQDDDDSDDKIVGIAPPCNDDEGCGGGVSTTQRPLVRPPQRNKSRGNGLENTGDDAPSQVDDDSELDDGEVVDDYTGADRKKK